MNKNQDRIQELRQYDRRIHDLNKEIVHKLTKLDDSLQRCNIRISNYVSTTDSKGYKSVVSNIIEGRTLAEELIKGIHGRTVNNHGRLASLSGIITEIDIDIIRQLHEEVELAQRHKDECQSKMDRLCKEWFPE